MLQCMVRQIRKLSAFHIPEEVSEPLQECFFN